MMLDLIRGPEDLRELTYRELNILAAEIREFLIAKIAVTGGHLGPNLGVVELTLSLHRIFTSPCDALIFDTGHQAYVHKLLTGRSAGFANLRKKGGLSGYPSRRESIHDWVESSHASSSLSYADGLAKSFELTGQEYRRVVVIVGDGALTGGMCWEALNNIACSRRRIVIVVNDNGRSYAPTSGALAAHLATLRLTPWYEKFLFGAKRWLNNVPFVGRLAYAFMHSVKLAVKDAVAPQAMFGDLGLKYVGPVDGHDQRAVELALRRARKFDGPVLVHVITCKGKGYGPAENDEMERMHTTGVIDPQTGHALKSSGQGWTGSCDVVVGS
jgi:1-deoxy-D-xylulose-5-phosphate synthase